MVITSKRKRYSGHWVMRGEEVVGEIWKYKIGSKFGMSLGGYFTTIPLVCWRDGNPAKSGFSSISAPRLLDLLAIAEKYFNNPTKE